MSLEGRHATTHTRRHGHRELGEAAEPALPGPDAALVRPVAMKLVIDCTA